MPHTYGNYVPLPFPEDLKKCVEWQGTVAPSGYGVYRGKGAHRFFWEQMYGKIPKGMHVCHYCDNPKCVRVVHLFLGTPKENMQDKVRKGRTNSKGIHNGSAKLTDQDIAKIRDMSSCGFTQREIAKRFGISQSAVSRVLTGFCWSHV